MSGPSVSDVIKEAARMMSSYLLETEGLSHFTEEELLARLEITKIALTGVLGTSMFLSDDGFAFCKALGFDVGLAVRKPDGSEFIFYPAKNFGLDSPQSSPRFAKQEPLLATPAPLAAVVPAVIPPFMSALPFSQKKKPIGFFQNLISPTPKAETADPEANPLSEINEYEV